MMTLVTYTFSKEEKKFPVCVCLYLFKTEPKGENKMPN